MYNGRCALSTPCDERRAGTTSDEIRDGSDRGMPAVPPEALPAEMVHLLLTRVGLTEAEVAAMTKAEAAQRLNDYWSTGR